LTAACSVNPVTRTPEVTLVSVADEQRLGAEMARQIEQQIGLVDDASLRAYVAAIGSRLVADLPQQVAQYRFQIVDMNEPNAFALPGGYVYVSRGLLALANSEDELAAVIGHEIGHVAARHHARQQTRSTLATPFTLATGLAGAVTGIVAPRLGSAISGAGALATGGLLAYYSREQEREADAIGVRLAAGGGWDPAAMSSLLVTLSRDEIFERGSERAATFLDSHPAPPERATSTAAQALMLTRAARAPVAGDHDGFLAELDGMRLGDDPAEGSFRGGRFLHPALGFSIRFPDGWDTHNTRTFAAAAAPDGSALAMLEAAGQGDDPMRGAAAINRRMGFSLADVERTTIGGLPAARYAAVTQTQHGLAVADFAWIAYEGTIYQVIGVTSQAAYEADGGGLSTIPESFRPLTADERSSLTEIRLRLVRARGSETLRDLLQRVDSTWGPERAAIANGIRIETVLTEGRRLKLAVEEPYVFAERS
jgi:predicted Zn-dependent protease